jgi:dTDP-4-dehydrorhamnose 3,5-epimerase
MEIREFEISGVKLVVPKKFGDARGYFQETWSERLFQERVENVSFVQDNYSFSTTRGTLRGLHFQTPPFAQGKLVRVLTGSIFDVAVDIRRGSPTFGQHVAVTLNAIDGAQLWVPAGFLHGFCTLEDSTSVFYKVTSYYSSPHDAGVIWNDPDLHIPWPVSQDSAVLSEKDQRLPHLSDLQNCFDYQE